MRSGPKLKVYSKAKILRSVELIDSGLGLDKCSKEIGNSYYVFARNMQRHYGKKKWQAIIDDRNNLKMYRDGHLPWNTGTGICPGGTENWDKIQAMGNEVNRKPVGTIVIRKQLMPQLKGRGRRKSKKMHFIKIADSHWEKYARYIWEQKHGKIAPGMCIVHLDKNTLNDEYENLYCMTLGDYKRYLQHRFPKDYAKSMARSAKSRTGQKYIRRAKTDFKQECTGCAFETKLKQCPKCGGFSFQGVLSLKAMAKKVPKQ